MINNSRHSLKFKSQESLISPDQLWQTAAENQVSARTNKQAFIQPERFEAFTLDADLLKSTLASAPTELMARSQFNPLVMTLPMPDGTFAQFQVEESPIMEPALAAKFPEIKTYQGQGIDDRAATVRFDVTPAGFHAQVLSPNGTFYIDPYFHLDDSLYISYFKKDYLNSPDREFHEHLDELDSNLGFDKHPQISRTEGDSLFADHTLLRSGSQLRTYQLAVAATGEYTQFHGGTVALGQAAIVTAINRVNGIYENELAVRLQLVANNNQLVYTNAATDPYSNNDAGALLDQNQANIDSVIGNANYDVGHVFTTGGGGVAGLGVVGVTGYKAWGETGLSNPIGDPFYVDYVAHELGHQFGGDHTFNSVTDACGGGNRNASTAYEPGSGSTIQAYAGICGSDDLQPNSDPYFHSISFDQIRAYVTTGAGNSAATITSTGNTAPTVSAGSDYTIPAHTPFQLTATGSDADGDTLTYNWEERDLGPALALSAADNGSSPLFRSFNPTLDPSRTFPKLSSILNNTTSVGEKLPSTNRNLNFRATVRDNRVGGGGVNTDDMTITVINTGTPFQVTSNNTAVSWTGGSSQNVTWDVAGTTAAPIGASQVSIFLSTDGGQTFPTVLAANTPNDGSQTIVVPNINTTTARIKVKADNNIFFDISNANLTIVPGSGIGTPNNDTLIGSAGNDTLNGLNGQDLLQGLAGDDRLLGGGGNDTLDGDLGRDNLIGGQGNDWLLGGSDNDVLQGQVGNDTLTGNSGADRLMFRSGAAFTPSALGVDLITDFNTSESDKITLSKVTFPALTATTGQALSLIDFAVINAATDGATEAGNSTAPIVLNTFNGSLYYNENGSTTGLGTGGQFATLNAGLSLSRTDFRVTA
jgi:Ca2+-binding RTX toxin-like protein